MAKIPRFKVNPNYEIPRPRFVLRFSIAKKRKPVPIKNQLPF